MPLIQLEHLKALHYPGSKDLPLLPLDIEVMRSTATVVSFRQPAGKPDQFRKRFHACERFIGDKNRQLVFYGIETDSPLAPLILWDAAHELPVDGTMLLAGDHAATSYLERAYFRSGFVVERKDAKGTLFRKIAPMLAEQDSGLNRWSFCIPTGPEDATLLNVVVKRILEIDVPEKEILLCGRPGANFKYLDRVRIVGEDISGTPVPICQKKNRLAQEARFENLCILHDRVFLPRDFGAAVRKFGDSFPITTFQSIYFDDRWNFVARRYSDLGRPLRPLSNLPAGILRSPEMTVSPFAPLLAIQSTLERKGYIYGHAQRYDEGHYATGSLYITKRKVWLFSPQNEGLAWTEFEDIEHAKRCTQAGIPNRVNPYGMTQSILGRALLSISGRVTFESIQGEATQSAGLPYFSMVPKKPLIKLDSSEAYRRLESFSQKYISKLPRASYTYRNTTAENRLFQVGAILSQVELPYQKKAIDEFINDYEKLILLDQCPYGTKNWLADQMYAHGASAKVNFFEHSAEMMNHVAQRPSANWFYNSLYDYLPRRNLALNLGSLFSAWRLSRGANGLFYFPSGFWNCYLSIMGNTPFVDYVEDSA
jgi:hypothetical protein